ncbi:MULTISPECIES: hypothetical protein [unclassified Luteimonas]
MRTRRTRLSALCAAILATASFHAHAVRIDYSLDAGVERNDNILMSSTDPEESSALRAGFGFVVTQESSTVQANFGGRLEYWNYIDGPQSNAFESTLSGRLNWSILPETLSFTVENSLEMRPIDRFAADTVDNRQRVNVLALGPNVDFNWNQAVRGRAELRWIDSQAEEADALESQRVSAALHAIRTLDPTSSLTLSLRGQDVDFRNDTMARDYRRYDGYMRYDRQLSRLGFGLIAGYTWVDYADGDSTSHPLFRAHAEWAISARTALSLSAEHQLTDASDSAIGGISVASTVPDSLSGGSFVVDPSIYEEDRIELTWAYRHDRVGFTVGPYYERVDFIDAPSVDETRRGVVMQLTYRLAPTWDLRTFADAARTEFPDLGQRTEDRRFGLGVGKTWSRHWSSALDYVHYARRDDGPVGNSRQNVWYLTVTYRNR